MRVSKTTTFTLTGVVTLRELREIVDSTRELDPGVSVSINQHRGDQRDPSYVTVTVNDR